MKIQAAAVIGVLLFSSSAVCQNQNWFKLPRVYESPGGDFRCVGDADGDGDVDIIRLDGQASVTPSSFTLLLNSGQGEFTPWSSATLATGTSSLLIYEDVNGDGIRDVLATTIMTHLLGSGVDVWPGLPGGNFGSPIHVSLPGNPYLMRVGRGDAGPIKDIAVVHFEPAAGAWKLRWILGDVANAFVVLPGNTLAPTDYVEDMVLADQNGDGIDDFAVAYNGAVHFFVTVAGSPTGVGPTLNVSTATFGFALIAADVDSDGDRDILAATVASPGFSIQPLRNQGGGSWASGAVQVFQQTSMGSMFLGDWDADGFLDLLMREPEWASSGYGFYRNTGNGTFAATWSRDMVLPNGISGGAGLFDVDGDQHLDYVDSQAIFMGDGTFTDPMSTLGIEWHRVRDWEGDGDVDVPLQGGQVRRNDGRGAFTTTSVTMPANPPGHAYSVDVVLEDLDGNGLNDMLLHYSALNLAFPPLILSTFIEMRRFADNGDGTLTNMGLAATTAMVNTPFVFTDDVDGDGDLDLLTKQGLWTNNGATFFGNPASVFQQFEPVARGDVDFDGDQDYLATFVGGSTGSMAFLRRTGPGVFAVQPLFPTTTSTVLTNLPVLADLDDDGDLDVAVDNDPYGTSITIFANANGNFSQAHQITLFGDLPNTTVAAGDVDGDGLTDLAFGSLNRVRIYRRIGPGFVYAPPVQFRTIGFRSLVDIDNDGDLDILGHVIGFNRRFDGPTAGFSRQYGAGKPGTAGRTPVLGMPGPLRVGLSPRLTLRELVGGAPAIIVRGALEGNFPNFGVPGLTLYVNSIEELLEFTLPGTPGQPGGGAMDVIFAPLSPALAGGHAFLQIGIVDAGASFGIASTNGLEILIGF